MKTIPRFLTMWAGASSVFADGKSPNGKKEDSLQALRMMISIEPKPGNRVLICKDESFTDSLKRCGSRGQKKEFDKLIGDSSGPDPENESV